MWQLLGLAMDTGFFSNASDHRLPDLSSLSTSLNTLTISNSYTKPLYSYTVCGGFMLEVHLVELKATVASGP